LKKPHIPVLLNEVIESFSDITDGTVVDCTLGFAGHSNAILKSNKSISLIGIDQDKTAIEYSTNLLKPFNKRVEILQGRFADKTADVLKREEGPKISAILADIGVSSLQLDSNERGFGFNDMSLDMRMNQNQTLSAYEVINNYSKTELEHIFREYGEVQSWRKVAEIIIKNRPIESAKKLSELVSAFGKRGSKIHSSTLIFQAIRIEVNDELGELNRLLKTIENFAPNGCRVAIISFHSLEDRIVKQKFKEWTKSCICDSRAMRCTCGNNHAKGKVVTKKPMIASPEELKINPRSRSAKMRVFNFAS